MKTIPLDDLLQQITPLPYRVDGTHEVEDITDPSPARHKVLRSDSERWVALAEALDVEGDCTACYLAHAANVLPELVTALNPDQLSAWASYVERTYPGIASDLRDMATAQRQALAKANTVPV